MKIMGFQDVNIIGFTVDSTGRPANKKRVSAQTILWERLKLFAKFRHISRKKAIFTL